MLQSAMLLGGLMISRSLIGHKLEAFRRLRNEKGLRWTATFLAHRLVISRLLQFFAPYAKRQISKWSADIDRPIHLFMGGADFAYPYRQRPQHIVRELARRGEPVVYVSPSSGYDRVYTTELITPNFVLTPHREVVLNLFDSPIVHVLSTDASLDSRFFERVRLRGGTIIYDYIDALDDAVSSGHLNPARLALHREILADEDNAVVVTTANELLDEVKSIRSQSYGLVTNGVDPEPFIAARRGSQIDPRLSSVIVLGKPIVGYFGSFAKWFDYDLLNACAAERTGYEFVLIGPDLDGTRDRLAHSSGNITLLGAMSYSELPRHAVWFDVCLVPFVVNHITLATSPLKIFEYMSLGRPTVSSDLPECRKYRSVLIARDAPEFCRTIDRALTLSRDENFISLARTEGEANSWERKVDDVLALISEHQRSPRSSASSSEH